jgi:alkylglycerol monooxygenase
MAEYGLCVVLAMVAFAVAIGGELAYGVLRGRNTYALHDTIGSLGQGLLSQWVAACTWIFQAGLYALAWHAFGFSAGDAWNTWYGWIGAVVLFDFCDYWLHRAGHRSAIFWAAHVVHHQSTRFNFSTALRQESLTEVLGWPFFLPMALAGVPPEVFAGAGLAVNVYQFWVHTEHVGKLGWFDRVFSSPSNHRVHHAINDGYLDKNYGGLLVVWDRMFGTFVEEREPCVYGTKAPLASTNPLWVVGGLYCSLWMALRGTQGWRARLQLLLSPPGNLPCEAPRRYSVRAASAWKACALFGLLVVATGVFLWQEDNAPWLLCVAGTALLLATLCWIDRALLANEA